MAWEFITERDSNSASEFRSRILLSIPVQSNRALKRRGFSSIMTRTTLAGTSAEKPKGAVAQLGERMNGIHEVRGSIPLGSTKLD